MLGAGFMWLSAVQGLVQFVGAFLVMAVGASLAGLLSLTTVVVNWFDRHRAKALSLMATGMSLGGLTIPRSEEHTSELQSLMRNSYAVFCLKKKKTQKRQ